MQNLLQDLIQLLEQDDRFVVEGKPLKNRIVESALALDPALIKLLLLKETVRNHFFVELEGVLIFDKIKFQQFVSNKQFLPDSYTAFKNKIGLTADGDYLTESKEVALVWPYKDCVLEGGQEREDAKRNEIFWNETLAADQIDRLLAPKVLTGFKRYTASGEQAVTQLSPDDNLIIKGNNLLALHTLAKIYAGKVKLIYIDPPYNTGNDSFGYNDKL
jgi:adenine-specific DNA-methyltransferase